jgi:hypothetical protein
MGNDLTITGRTELATIERQFNADITIVRELRDCPCSDIPKVLERAQTLDVAAVKATAVMLRQPATDHELETQLAVLAGSFPTAPKINLEIFGRALIEEIADANPSRGALIRACRQLRRTSKFLPTICEVLEAIEKAELHLMCFQADIQRLPEMIEHKKAHYQRECRYEREKQIAKCFDLLQWRKTTFGPPDAGLQQQIDQQSPDIVAEAQVILDRAAALGGEAWRSGKAWCQGEHHWYCCGKLIRADGKMVT